MAAGFSKLTLSTTDFRKSFDANDTGKLDNVVQWSPRNFDQPYGSTFAGPDAKWWDAGATLHSDGSVTLQDMQLVTCVFGNDATGNAVPWTVSRLVASWLHAG